MSEGLLGRGWKIYGRCTCGSQLREMSCNLETVNTRFSRLRLGRLTIESPGTELVLNRHMHINNLATLFLTEVTSQLQLAYVSCIY